MTDDIPVPLISTPVEVHGTSAWVILARDRPLASMTMSYPAAEKLYADLGDVLANRKLEDLYPGGWFGESWGAPICEPARHKPTPVGELCVDCHIAINSKDQGHLIPFVNVRSGTHEQALAPYHRGCFVASIIPLPPESD